MHARFLLSAASAEQFPRTGIPEIALVGRSNVGKSSLINALTRQKIARTSAAPGKTRLANYYEIDAPHGGRIFFLVDLPGYGYARGGAESAEAFETLTRVYFDRGQAGVIAGVMHLIDSRHPDLAPDARAFDWLMKAGLRVAIVATKVDKLNRADQARAITLIENKYGVPVLAVSVMNGSGLDEIWKTLRHWVSGPTATT